jgi:hypothetical protein
VTDKIRGKIRWVRPIDFLAGLTLFFASLLFFVDLLEGKYLLTERDLGPYFIPPRFFWVESIKQGDFPLWNPYQFCGHPFFANPQQGVLYPFNTLFFMLPFDVAFNAIIILHFFLGGLFTFLFLRDIKVSPSGALISGLIFMLSGYFLSIHSLLPILLSSVWTPLIMMFFRRAINNKDFKNEILTAIFITLSFLGGGIEVVYGNFFVLLFMIFFTSQTNPPSPPFTKGGLGGLEKWLCNLSNWNRFWLRVRSLLIVSILFLFLSAIQLFPFVELLHHSIRGKGISYQEATIWSFAPKDILLFFLPDAYGYFLDVKRYWVSQCWLKTLYTGGLPFILSTIFFISGKGRKLFFFLMVFSLFLSLGNYNPLYPFVFKYIPFFNGIRYPVKFLHIFILVLSITAGLGFHRLTELLKEGKVKGYKNLFFILSLLCGFLLLTLVLGHQKIEYFLKLREIDFPQFNHLSANLFHAKRFFFYLALFFLTIRIGNEVKWKSWARMLLILFLIADLFGNMGFYGKEKTEDYFQETKIIEKVSSDHGDFRIFSTGKTISFDTPVLIAGASPLDVFKEKHIPSLHLISRLHDIWGIDVIRLKRVDELYHALTGATSISATQLLELYGVKYVISISPIEETSRYELIYARIEGLHGEKEDLLRGNTIKLYKHRSPFPRAWLVKDFKVMDSKAIFSRIIQKGFDPGQEVFLEEEIKMGRTLSNHGVGNNKVEFISEANNWLQLHVETKEDSILVLSDTYYPGWKVFVDGNPEMIYRANYTFRAVPLSAGTHRVEFVYDPVSFKLGAGVTFLGILVCLGMGWIGRRKKKN